MGSENKIFKSTKNVKQNKDVFLFSNMNCNCYFFLEYISDPSLLQVIWVQLYFYFCKVSFFLCLSSVLGLLLFFYYFSSISHFNSSRRVHFHNLLDSLRTLVFMQIISFFFHVFVPPINWWLSTFWLNKKAISSNVVNNTMSQIWKHFKKCCP